MQLFSEETGKLVIHIHTMHHVLLIISRGNKSVKYRFPLEVILFYYRLLDLNKSNELSSVETLEAIPGLYEVVFVV